VSAQLSALSSQRSAFFTNQLAQPGAELKRNAGWADSKADRRVFINTLIVACCGGGPHTRGLELPASFSTLLWKTLWKESRRRSKSRIN
jgi:hypothetical protein